jgi:hypothetical protein
MVEKPSNKSNDFDDSFGLAVDDSMMIGLDDQTPIMIKENNMDI